MTETEQSPTAPPGCAPTNGSEVHHTTLELLAEKKAHDETIELLKTNTQELNACCDHIKRLESCLSVGLEEHAALHNRCEKWRRCAEELARQLIEWDKFTGNTETAAAIAEFEKMQRSEQLPNKDSATPLP